MSEKRASGLSVSFQSQCCHENFGPKNFRPVDQNFLGPPDHFFQKFWSPSENFGPLANNVKIDLWCQLDAYR